jgi:hypothetical protein
MWWVRCAAVCCGNRKLPVSGKYDGNAMKRKTQDAMSDEKVAGMDGLVDYTIETDDKPEVKRAVG